MKKETYVLSFETSDGWVEYYEGSLSDCREYAKEMSEQGMNVWVYKKIMFTRFTVKTYKNTQS